MRIIGGKLRSRPLQARVPAGTRPTSDRLRETLFNILGPRVIESVFLDAYAGTGAVGIEALSRGAASAYLVDRSPAAARAIRANLESLGIAGSARVLNTDLRRALESCERSSVRFRLAFLDPPYDREDLYRRDLERLGSGSLLEADAWMIAEHPGRVPLPETVGRWVRFRTLGQRSSALSFYHVEETASEAGRGDLSGDV